MAPKVWENLEQQGISQEAMDDAAAEAAAEAAAAEEEELRRLKTAELAREALNRAKDIDWKSTADAAKKERELDEKYGVWKHIILSPWFQWLMGLIDDIVSIELWGEPRMAPAATIILLYMLFKARQSLSVITLAAAFFFNLHPVLIVGTAVGLYTWAKLRRPKGYDPARPPPKGPVHVNVSILSSISRAYAKHIHSLARKMYLRVDAHI